LYRFAVLLAGCGVFDGSEIHESVSTLISISKNGCEYVCFSSDNLQYNVIDHSSQKGVKDENRNMMVEAARISRGEIKKIEDYNPNEFDALIIPGGFGVAKNFFSFVQDGINCTINESIQDAILKTHKAGKIIGAMCISPALVVRAFRDTGIQVEVTGGIDTELIVAIEKMGGKNVECDVKESYYDRSNKIVSTPAYISANNIYEVYQGVESMVNLIIRELDILK